MSTQSGVITQTSYPASWVGFCTYSPGIKHFVHFLPIDNAKNSIAPLQTTISLFAAPGHFDEVTYGGARAGQPDGVRLFDAFPLWYDENKKIWGIKVTLSPERGATNLFQSKCIFESSAGNRSVRFFGAPCLTSFPETGEQISKKKMISVIQDVSLLPSIVVVNSGETPFSPHFVWADTQAPVLLEAVAPGAVKEVPLELAKAREPVAPVELSWGKAYVRLLEPVGQETPYGCAAFLVHRVAEENGERGRIVSVVTLGGRA